jgi:hypothetical protein
MTAHNIVRLLNKLQWNTLQRIYGSAHNSIIGFISSEWIKQSGLNSVLDGAPSPKTGKGRKGQKNADILLCQRNKPYVVVEVETGVEKYNDKIDSLWDYMSNSKDYKGLEFGLLVMTNGYAQSSKLAYRHNWESVKKKVTKKEYSIALVSIEKSKAALDESILARLRRRNNYYPQDIVNIDYWIFDGNDIRKGNFWKQ